MLLTKNSCRTCHTSFKTFGRWDPTKEYRLSHLCSFETGDIRKKIKELNNFDIIILGAIGQVFGDYFTTGNMVSIREGSVFGKHCSVGTFSDIQGDVKFGNYCRLNSHVQIASKCVFGSFVFIYPMVVFTNDPLPPSKHLVGTIVGDFSQIAAGSIILPGLSIGKHCLIGANSLINKSVADYEFHAGNPAVRIGKTTHIWSKEDKRPHYPWPYNFDRGMPWAEIGFDEWTKTEEGKAYALQNSKNIT